MYEVGDIIYLLSRKNHKIVPARIESVTTVKKMNGVDVTHELAIPGSEPTQKIVLEKLDVEKFQDISSLREYMLDVLQQQVNNDISVVSDLVAATWPSESAKPVRDEDLHLNSLNNKKDAGVVKVQLPDGSTANVQMPQELI